MLFKKKVHNLYILILIIHKTCAYLEKDKI